VKHIRFPDKINLINKEKFHFLPQIEPCRVAHCRTRQSKLQCIPTVNRVLSSSEAELSSYSTKILSRN